MLSLNFFIVILFFARRQNHRERWLLGEGDIYNCAAVRTDDGSGGLIGWGSSGAGDGAHCRFVEEFHHVAV